MSAGPVRVVLADDASQLCALLARALEKDGRISVVGIAGDGEEALEMVRELRPDVLVLDISMPKLDGLGVLRELSARTERCPVVVLTGYASSDLAAACRAAGASRYVEKGVAVSVIRDAVMEAAGAA